MVSTVHRRSRRSGSVRGYDAGSDHRRQLCSLHIEWRCAIILCNKTQITEMMIPEQIVTSTEAAASESITNIRARIWRFAIDKSAVVLGPLLGIIGAFLLAWLCGTPLPF